MPNLDGQKGKLFHVTRFGKNEFEFDSDARQVAILDRTGQPIWSQVHEPAASPIRWSGTGFDGEEIATGDYVCKIVYPNEKVAYLPFSFNKTT